MVGARPLQFSALLGKKLANSAALCCSAFFVQVQLVGLISAQECPVGWHWNKVCFRGVLCHHSQKRSKVPNTESKKQFFGSSFSTIGGQCSFLLHGCIFCWLPIGLTHGPAIHTSLGGTELLENKERKEAEISTEFWHVLRGSETFWKLLICYESWRMYWLWKKTWDYKAISFVLLLLLFRTL